MDNTLRVTLGKFSPFMQHEKRNMIHFTRNVQNITKSPPSKCHYSSITFPQINEHQVNFKYRFNKLSKGTRSFDL